MADRTSKSSHKEADFEWMNLDWAPDNLDPSPSTSY